MPTRKCSQCRRSFTVPYPSTRKQRCSKCRYRNRKTRADKGARKANWVTVQCANCGKGFERPPGYVRRREKQGYRLYCSWRCRDANAGTYSGRPKSGRQVLHNEGYVVIHLRRSERPKGQEHTERFLEHRLVMARVLGRELLPTETVHHVDGDKTNNAPENLQLRVGRHGKGSHYRCRACGSTDIEAVSFKES